MSNRLKIGMITSMLLLLGAAGCNADRAGVITGDGAGGAPSLVEMEAILRGQLAERGIDPDRAASIAPTGGENEVFFLTAAATAGNDGVDLQWNEMLVGDYDQNSEVGISDLTPLGVYFLQTVGYRDPASADGYDNWPTGSPQDDGGVPDDQPSDEDSGARNWRKARVDGDGNGEVNIADITPIAQHFGQSIDGYRVYAKAEGESEFTMLPNPDDGGSPLTIARARAEFNATRPVLYNVELELAITGEVDLYVAPYDIESATEGTPSRTVTVSAQSTNEPPTVSVEADTTAGPQPLQVQFTATASDPDGTITGYTWDPHGDGTFEESTGTTPTFDFQYTTPGSYSAAVRVTDNEGASATASVQINVTGPMTHVIAGTIVDGAAQPLPDVTVTLEPGTVVTTTDANGEYGFSSVADGSYTVTPELAGYGFTPGSRAVNVAGADELGVDFTGTTGPSGNGVISGVTMKQTGPAPPPPGLPPREDLPGVTLELRDGTTNAVLDTTVSDGSGFWEFTGLDQEFYYKVVPVSTAVGSWFPPERHFFGSDGFEWASPSTGNQFTDTNGF